MVGSGWSTISDANVSEGEYLTATSGNNFYSSAPTDAGSWISFDFTASAGSYEMYALINTPNTNNDSFWVRANGGTWVKWNNLLSNGGFDWRQLYDSDANANLVSFELAEGANTLDIAIRENGAAIDKIYLSDSGTAPTGLGGPSTNCMAAALTVDAGADITVVLPNTTAVLSGSAVDPNEGVLTYQWTQVSGPNTAMLTGSGTAELTADNLVEGDYVFSLAVTDESNNTVSDDVMVSVVTAPSQIWLEAECAVVGSGWSTISDANVSEGEYLTATSGNNFYSSAPTDAGSWISFDFTASAGSYEMYALINAPNTNTDSFWVRTNGGAWIKWNGLLRQGGFDWRQLYDSDANANLVSFELAEGANTLDIAIRENGAAIDKIYLSDSGTAPTGLGGPSTNCMAAALTVDAGADITVVLPNTTAVLSGSAVDPNEGVLTYQWTQVSGPNTAMLTGSGTAELTADNLVEGDYVFSLAVTDESNNTVSDDVMVSVVTAPSQIWLEAECAVVGSGWSTISDANVSEGEYLTATSGNNFYSSAPTDAGSWISFDFTASAGSYEMYALINAPNTNTDSFWVRTNGGAWIKWNGLLRQGGFDWRQLYDSDANANLVSFELAEGANTLDIAIRENGAAIDKIYLSDSGTAPMGLGGHATNCVPADTDPLADAGVDLTIMLPDDTALLNGTGSDPDGGTVTYFWTQVSGPNTATLTNETTADLAAEALVEGIYEFDLAVTDDEGNTISDQASVTVEAAFVDEQPIANAGVDLTVTLPDDAALLSGTGSDPDGGTVTYFWTQVSGPNTATLTNETTTDLTAGTLVEGIYEFDLAVTDDEGNTVSDQARVAVGSSFFDELPLADAGEDVTIILPDDTAVLNGTGSDPDGGTVTYLWTQLGGPNTAVLTGADTTGLTAESLVEGTYEFDLAVTDDEGNTISEQVLVTVEAAFDELPLANAGEDVTITLPDDTVVLNGTGSDPDGGTVTYLWTQLGGPNTAVLTGADTTGLTAESLVGGTYEFDLAVTDDEGNTISDQVSVTVEAAPSQIWLEAECAVVGSGWSLIPDTNASEGEYLTATSGANFYSSAPTDSGFWISFAFTASAGSYEMYALINTPTTNNDSFWVRANGGAWIKWNNLLSDGSFEWGQLYDSDANADLIGLELTEGENTLDIAIREDGASIDKIYLSDSEIIPTGLGGAATNCGPVDALPLVDAGDDVTLILPVQSTILNGTGSDPDGGSVIYQWTQISGPNTATLIKANTANPTVDALIEGDYVFSLAVTDESVVTITDEMNLSVIKSGDIYLEAECGTAIGAEWATIDDSNAAGNQYISASSVDNFFSAAPTDIAAIISMEFVANAGTYNMFALVNSPTEDSDSFWVRANGGTWIKWSDLYDSFRNEFIWIQVYDSDAGETPVTLNLLDGTNTIDFAIRESGANLDKVYLTNTGGLPSGLGHTATNCGAIDLLPLAAAGNYISLTLPTNSVVVKGSGNDPDGGLVSYTWTQLSGPAGALLTGSDTSSLVMENLVEGVYNLSLGVTDDEGNTSTSTVFIIVSAPLLNIPPSVSAGEDVSVASAISVILSGTGIDPDGGAISYLWSQSSGPTGILLSGLDTSDLTVDGLTAGVYSF